MINRKNVDDNDFLYSNIKAGLDYTIHKDKSSLLYRSGDVKQLAIRYSEIDRVNKKHKEEIEKSKGESVLDFPVQDENALLYLNTSLDQINHLVDHISSIASKFEFGSLSQQTVSKMMSIEDQLASVTTPYRFTIISSKNEHEYEVHQMVMDAIKGIPPASPYHPNEWSNIIEFIETTYGKYLKSRGGTDDCLFLDNLRTIHPDGAKLSKLRKRISLETDSTKKMELKRELKTLKGRMNSKEWGSDVATALYNYFRKKDNEQLTDFIKRKSDRGEKEREVLKENPHVLSVDPRASTAYLKKQYLVK